MMTFTRLCVLFSLFSFVPAIAQAQYEKSREIIGRVHNDLSQASEDAQKGNKGNKERERIGKAQVSISNVDKKLTKGKFDKGQVDKLLEGVQEIYDKNTLSPHTRDALKVDIADLQQMKRSNGRM